MASIIDSVGSAIGAGRQKIGLTGKYQGKDVTIDIDVMTSYTWMSNVEVTNHPVERDKNNPDGSISDHTIPKPPAITIDIVLSDNLNLDKNVTKFTYKNQSVSIKDKVKTLSYWQRNGSILTLEGYTAGSGMLGNALNYLKTGTAYNSNLDEIFYVGMDTDIIQNLVLGNIQWKRIPENGKDCQAQINLSRIHVAIAKTSSIENKQISNAPKREDAKSANTQSAQAKNKIQSTAVKSTKVQK